MAREREDNNNNDDSGTRFKRPRWQNSSNWRQKESQVAEDTSSNTPRQPVSNQETDASRGQRSSNQSRDTNSSSLNPSNERRPGHGSDAAAAAAFAEERRLYVGNLPYMAKREDVQDLFDNADGKPNGYYRIQRIDMSIDPFTGRNPSYGFVDLETKQLAEEAMDTLDGKNILGRPVKIKPGVPKKSLPPPLGRRDPSSQPTTQPEPFAFDRWGRRDASDHWYNYASTGRRLFVGGLPRMPDQQAADYEIRKLFYGFKFEAISKIIRCEPEKYRYLFVDFETAQEAGKAMNALKGVSAVWGSRVQIKKAQGNSRKPPERDRWREANEDNQKAPVSP